MRSFSKTSIAASLAALVLGLGGALSASPTDAAMHVPHGGGISAPHGGFGGGGGVGRGFTGGGHGRDFAGGGHGRGFGLGVLGGLAAGAVIGSAAYPYYYGDGGYYYDDGCYQYQPVYDQWGRYLGRQLADMCP